MVDQYSAHALLVLNEIKSLKNNSHHQVKISIPKVAKNGPKVPFLSIFEIRFLYRTHLSDWRLYASKTNSKTLFQRFGY